MLARNGDASCCFAAKISPAADNPVLQRGCPYDGTSVELPSSEHGSGHKVVIATHDGSPLRTASNIRTTRHGATSPSQSETTASRVEDANIRHTSPLRRSAASTLPRPNCGDTSGELPLVQMYHQSSG